MNELAPLSGSNLMPNIATTVLLMRCPCCWRETGNSDIQQFGDWVAEEDPDLFLCDHCGGLSMHEPPGRLRALTRSEFLAVKSRADVDIIKAEQEKILRRFWG